MEVQQATAHENSEYVGLYANAEMHSLLCDGLGRVIIVETRCGEKFEGILAGTSANFDIGLTLAHRLVEDADDILPCQNDVIDKLQINKCHVVSVSIVSDDKVVQGFVTDREYRRLKGDTNAVIDANAEFERWQEESDDVDSNDKSKFSKIDEGSHDGGWSVDKMFQANDALGVKSTFESDLSQYSNANVQGDNEARTKAEKIAQEIEKNPASKMGCALENDDEERDLDKATDDFQLCSGRRGAQQSRNSYTLGSRSGTAANVMRGGPTYGAYVNRRNEALISRGRGNSTSGFYGNTGTTSRSFTNSSLVHGGRSGGNNNISPQLSGSYSSQQRYNSGDRGPPAPGESRWWTDMRRTEAGGVVLGGVTGDRSLHAGHVPKITSRRFEQQQSQHHFSSSGVVSGTGTGTSNNKAIFETNNRLANQAHTNDRNGIDEPRIPRISTATTATAITAASPINLSRPPPQLMCTSTPLKSNVTENTRASASQAKRVEDLREFQQSFNSSYQSNGNGQASAAVINNRPDSNVLDSAKVKEQSVKPSTNAWNKGPPASIIKASVQSQAAVAISEDDSKKEALQEKEKSVLMKEESSAADGAKTKVEEVNLEGETVSSSVGSQSPPAQQKQPSPQPTTPAPANTASSATTTDNNLPSAARIESEDTKGVVDSSISTSDAPQVSRSSDTSKKFEWNPDAAPFTPRSMSHSGHSASSMIPGSVTTHLGSTATATVHVQSSNAPLTAVTATAVAQSTATLPQQSIQTNILPHGTQQIFPYAASNVYAQFPLYYSAQPLIQTSHHVGANLNAGSVAGGPIVTANSGRGPQVSSFHGSTNARRPLQGAGMYIPGQTLNYPQQIMSQYQVPFYAPYQQLSIAASVPPPNVPPPVSNSMVPSQGFQVIQTQAPHSHQLVAYSRQIYPGTQNYMMSAAQSRFQQSHIDHTIHAQTPPCVTPSNGNGSNGHNSQSATPAPQPISSPPQVQYPQSGTPQSPHAIMLIPPTAAVQSQQMYVQATAAQFSLVPGQANYMFYNGAQQMMHIHPTALANAQAMAAAAVAHSAHQPQQFSSNEHYTNGNEQQQQQQGTQQQANSTVNTILQHQNYPAEQQIYTPYFHAPQFTPQQQAQAISSNVIRPVNTSGAGANVPSTSHSQNSNGAIN